MGKGDRRQNSGSNANEALYSRLPTAHLLLCDPVPNRPQTGTSPPPRGLGTPDLEVLSHSCVIPPYPVKERGEAHSLYPEIGSLVNSEEGCREEWPLRTKQEVISVGYGSPEADVNDRTIQGSGVAESWGRRIPEISAVI